MSNKVIWIVEDDKLFVESLRDEAHDLGVKVKFFDYAAELAVATGNPYSILIDLGSLSLGLMRETHHYLSVIKAIRDKYPGAPIYLHSGLDEFIGELVEEIGDPMVRHTKILGGNAFSQVLIEAAE